MNLDYLAAVAGLTTKNQFNRLHIELEKIMTPLEVAKLTELDRTSRLPPEAGNWLRGLQAYSPTMAKAPEPYVATKINDRLTWYRAPRDKGAIARRIFQSLPTSTRQQSKITRKPVLVAFCGIADRLFLPLPVVLQALPAADWDVLKITRIPENHYLRPGSEIEDLNGLLAAIRCELSRESTLDVTCFGTSVGGGVALLVAQHINARRCISISGNLRDTCMQILPALSGANPQMASPLDRSRPNILHIHGEYHNRDREYAHRLQSFFGGQILSVPGVRKHNIQIDILQQDRFKTEFNPLMHGSLRLGEEWNATDAQS